MFLKEFFNNIKSVWTYARSEKRRIVIYFICSAMNVGFGIIFPFISAKIVVSLTSEILDQFIMMGLVLLVVSMISNLCTYFKSKLYEKVFRNIYINIQSNLGSEILKLNNKTLEENGSGVFIQRLIGDTKSISTIFTDLNRYINSIVGNIGILVTYFVLSKKVLVLVIISFIIRLVLEIKRINKYNENEKAYRELNDDMTGFTGEIVRGAEDIKMLNAEKSFLFELKRKFEHINIERYKMQNTNLSYLLVRWNWSEISYFLLLLLLALEVRSGSLTVAYAVVLYNFGNRYNGLVQSITDCHELIKKFNLSATRIFEIFSSEKYEKETFGDYHLDKVNGDFEFKNVDFKYDKNKVLKGLNFKVNANETVAFVGKSGAGKTTIFNLLCKMYDDYKGEITIDGVDIKKLDKDSIRGNITIVSQNPYIFNMSIKENLKLVKQDLTDKEMHEALKLACLDDFVKSLPEGVDTVVGEGGVTLSGGQKQRLAIARAFVQKTEIILFDEATSALDNETQSKIQKAIDNLQKNYTILIIAHRLSTIKNANRILFLDKGKIIAEGSHEKLMKKCKEYKELYETEISKIDD